MADIAPLVATYRLQLTPSFGLDDAAALVPYLARLGISHVYTSSYLSASAGSTHGYDTVDHATVSAELGGEAALVRFHAALRAHGLGNVVDVVPNHVSVADASVNQRWWNVLRDGASSPDARFFDIDWEAPEAKLRGKVLLPVLGSDYAAEVASGAITLGADPRTGAPEIHYGDLRLPVADGTVIDPAEPDVHEVLEQQHYRLACWRVARDELDYRRFFDVTTLAGVRIEDPDVFAAVHERTLGWVSSGDVHGLRVDHPDGLRDPAGYLADLRAGAPDAWIVIEKILEPGERVPAPWPIDGTTGYDVMRRITGLFVDPSAERALTTTFEAFTGDDQPYAARVVDCKRLVLRELLGTEVTRLTELASRCCESSVVARDFSRREVRLAVEALLATMPVYRTYVTGSAGDVSATVSDRDAVIITDVVRGAELIEPTVSTGLFQFLGGLLGGGAVDVAGTDFVARFQQLSGPTMAKGVEDTVFYRYNRLIALNEVGADPGVFGITIEEFHSESEQTAATHPRTMASTSTHDTKRSEDVRARIALLSEVPGEWDETARRWRTMNEPKWRDAAPDRAMEYMLYQTLVGAHPLSRERTHAFLQKAMREAKQVTTWLRPTPAEDAMYAFADALEDDLVFRAELDGFASRFRAPARIGALSQLALKAMGPGIPDFYQGSELWTTSLVDPDNRGDVDYGTRLGLLDTVCDTAPSLDGDEVGASKLWLTHRLLQVRRVASEAFTGPLATYRPVGLLGARSADAIAFERGRQVIAVAAVRPVRLHREGWADTRVVLPPGAWHDALAGSRIGAGRAFSGDVAVADVAGAYGVAVLVEAAVIGGDAG